MNLLRLNLRLCLYVQGLPGGIKGEKGEQGEPGKRVSSLFNQTSIFPINVIFENKANVELR